MISVDTPEDNKKFARDARGGLSNPQRRQRKKSPTSTACSGPAGFARRWTFYIAPDGKILHIDNAVKPASSGPDMVAKLGELKIAKTK